VKTPHEACARRPGKEANLYFLCRIIIFIIIVTGARQELSIALVAGNKVVYREALHVYATAGGSHRHSTWISGRPPAAQRSAGQVPTLPR
jgi:hypothetical protein